LAFLAKAADGTLFPRSTTLKPAPLSDFRTIAMGALCGSPSMAPNTTVPIGFSGSGGSFSIMDFNQDIRDTFFFHLVTVLFMDSPSYKLFVVKIVTRNVFSHV